MPLPKIKPPSRPTHPSMDKFRALVKSKGWTTEELRDRLVQGVMSHDPPSLSSVLKWNNALSDPRAHRIPQIETFLQTYSTSKGRPKQTQTDQTE